jgi:hypothetical protein
MELRNISTGFGAERAASEPRKQFEFSTAVRTSGILGVAFGEIPVILRANIASGIFFNVATRENPIPPESSKAFADVAENVGIAPGPAGVVDADRLVYFVRPVEKFGAAQFDFAEGDANVRMQNAVHEDLARVGKRVGAMRFE